jgi:hypothetical protein
MPFAPAGLRLGSSDELGSGRDGVDDPPGREDGEQAGHPDLASVDIDRWPPVNALTM